MTGASAESSIACSDLIVFSSGMGSIDAWYR